MRALQDWRRHCVSQHEPIAQAVVPGTNGGLVAVGRCGYNYDSGRIQYAWAIFNGGTLLGSGADLRTACGTGEGPETMLTTLLSFLEACAESIHYGDRTGRVGENADLFEPAVAEWAAAHSDEIGMLRLEREEAGCE